LTVVADQFGSPTFTRDLAGVIRDLVRTDGRGILRVTNTGFCSCFEFALEVLRQEGLNSRAANYHGSSKAPSQAFRRFGPFTGEPLCSWHDVAELAEGHKGVSRGTAGAGQTRLKQLQRFPCQESQPRILGQDRNGYPVGTQRA